MLGICHKHPCEETVLLLLDLNRRLAKFKSHCTSEKVLCRQAGISLPAPVSSRYNDRDVEVSGKLFSGFIYGLIQGTMDWHINQEGCEVSLAGQTRNEG